MQRLEDLELPEFDHTDSHLGGEAWHRAIEEVSRQHWLARTPLATVVLDREAGEAVLRSRSAKFPGREVADLFEIGSGPLREEIDHNIININGSEHQRLRSLVAPHFSPRAAETHRGWVAALFDQILAPLIDEREVEAVEDLCKPYASRAVCRLVGGPEDDADLLHDWSLWVQRQFDPVALANDLETLDRKASELQAWVRELLASKRTEPGDDLTSALLEVENDGDHLASVEVENLVTDVILGGIDTTQSQLAHTIRLLAESDEVWSGFANEGSAAAVVEESLRYEPVTPFTARLLTDDLEIRDVLFPAGTLLLVCSFTANRDPGVFPDPAGFGPCRVDSDAGGRILTFGAGIHYCLGANLARVELEEAARILRSRLSRIEPLPGQEFGNVSGIYSMETLPVRFVGHP